MMTKKEMKNKIDNLESIIKGLQCKVEALDWCMVNPTRIKVESEFVPSNRDCLTCQYHEISTSTTNSLFRNILKITYYDRMKDRIVTRDLINRESTYSLKILNVEYKWEQGDLKIIFESHHSTCKEDFIYQYSCNLYDVVSRTHPKIHYQDPFSCAWREVPFVERLSAKDTVIYM